jgi:hypothetical protein
MEKNNLIEGVSNKELLKSTIFGFLMSVFLGFFSAYMAIEKPDLSYIKIIVNYLILISDNAPAYFFWGLFAFSLFSIVYCIYIALLIVGLTLFQILINEAQKSIGLVAYNIIPDQNGMVSAGDLMNQPWTFEIFVSSRYDFNEKRSIGRHVVIGKTEFKLIQYSSDPREGTQRRKFFLPSDAARYCTLLQIMVAARLSESFNEELKSLNPKGCAAEQGR